ncbi:MAG: hypothetical protein ACRDYV_06570, partial [Acidimicrobiia bacterium]
MTAATEPFDDFDRLSPTALADWVGRRAAEVVGVAAGELPFYRDRFAAAGLDASSFSGLDDLPRIPILRKGDVVGLQRTAPGGGDSGIERLGGSAGRIVTVSSGTTGTTFLT